VRHGRLPALRAIFRTLAPADGYAHVGPSAPATTSKCAQRIEYGLLEAYAEGYEILHASQDFKLQLGKIGQAWNHGSVVRSWFERAGERAFSA